MPSVNAFWEVCGESVWITSSSSRRSSCSVSLVPKSSTSIEPDRIKASHNRFQNGLATLSLQIEMVARSSVCQSWVDCTTITAEVLDRYKRAKKQRVLCGGVHFMWEVADRKSFFPCFSDGDDKQASVSFLIRTLSASKRWSLHGFAFLPKEAAKQEGSEEIRSSLFSRWLMEPVQEGCAS